MAEGDEKIDHNDRVYLLNRLTDGSHDGIFDGKTLRWKPREIRSIQRLEADHFVRQSRVQVDPTGENPGVYTLVEVDQDQQPVVEGDSAEPLTVAYCKELTKFGFLDTTNLSPDRQFGGDGSMQLIDPDTGQHPTKVELRGAPKDGPIPQAPALKFAPHDNALDAL
jgi:hypothetical protein